MPQSLNERRTIRDYASRGDRLNPRARTPAQDRRRDQWLYSARLLFLAAVATGLGVLLVNLLLNLLTGD